MVNHFIDCNYGIINLIWKLNCCVNYVWKLIPILSCPLCAQSWIRAFPSVYCPCSAPFQAVCCSDHEHCCPQGYTCNMTSGTCERKDRRIFHKVPLFLVYSMEQEATTDPAPESTLGPTTETTPRLTLKPTPGPTLEPTPEPTPKPTTAREEVHCDENYHCPKTETCCMTSPTTWACCPSPKVP